MKSFWTTIDPNHKSSLKKIQKWRNSIISVESNLFPLDPPLTIPKVFLPRWKVEQPWELLVVVISGPGVNVVVVKSTNQVDAE